MDATTKSVSAPDRYQCIVCQMTTASLPRLHRHQTYQHTCEELSLSAIGLQASLINSVRANSSIAYDNSWLSDPTKQAEFYTVSARLLNDCDDNANCCAPVDYAVVREQIFCKIEEDGKIVESGSELLANHGDDNANCPPVDSIFGELNGNKWAEGLTIEDLRIGETNGSNGDLEEEFLGFLEKDMKPGGGFRQVEEEPLQGVQLPEEIKVEELPVGDKKADQFVDCADRLCCDLKKIKRKLPKAKKDPFRVPAPRKAKSRGKYSKIPRLEAKIDSAPNDNAETAMQIVEDAGISAANGSPGGNCVQQLKELAGGNCDFSGISAANGSPGGNCVQQLKELAGGNCDFSGISAANGSPGGNCVQQLKELAGGNCDFSGISAANGSARGNCVQQLKELAGANCDFSGTSAANGSADENCIQRPKEFSGANCDFSGTSAANGSARGNCVQQPKELAGVNCDFSGISAVNGSADENCIQQLKELTGGNCDFSGISAANGSARGNCVQQPKELAGVNCDFSGISAANGSADENCIQQLKELAGGNCDFSGISAANGSADGNPVQRISENETTNPVESPMEDIVEGRSDVPEKKTENRIDVRGEEENLTNGNFVVHPLETINAEAAATQDSTDTNSVEIKTEDFEREMDFASVDRSANSVESKDAPAEIPAEFTFPFYPPDMNDCSILVFDPEIHQLVWNSITVVDDPNEGPPESQVLTELTTADPRGSGNREFPGSQVENGSGASLPEYGMRGYASEERRRPRTNFVLRPRKPATRKSQRH